MNLEEFLSLFSVFQLTASFFDFQIFPYPEVLDEEKQSTLASFVEPTTKFFSEKNNAAFNDAKGEVPDEITKGMAELGAFGIMVPPEFGGLGCNNTQYGRLAEIVGAYDLALGKKIRRA